MSTRPRWLSIPDVTDLVLKRSNKVATNLQPKSRREQLRTVRRLVARAERRDEARITKRIGGDVYVRFDALESLLPADAAVVTQLEVAVVKVAADNRQIWKHVGAHGSKLREHDRKLRIIERKQAILAQAQRDLEEAERTA